MSEKDSYWFRHDSTAGRGLKMRKMAHIYGHWGKGIYWDVVEILRDQKDYLFESDTSSLQLLCDLIGCKDEQKFLNWFNDCVRLELFINDGETFNCPPLLKNMERWETKKNNGAKGGRPPKKKPNKNLNETELKPNQEANQKHKIIEDNITLYKEKDFLRDWNEIRTQILNKPSNVRTIAFFLKEDLKQIIDNYSEQEIKTALKGLFKQQNLPNGNTSIQTDPKHFIQNFERYYQAGKDMNPKIYGDV